MSRAVHRVRSRAVPCTRAHARREPSGSVVARADLGARPLACSPPPSSPASGRPRRWRRGRGAALGRRAWLRRRRRGRAAGLSPPAAGPPARAARVHRGGAGADVAARRGCRRACCASRSSTRRWSARAGRCRGSTRSATWPRGSALEVGELEWFADVRGLERRGRRRAPAPLPLRAPAAQDRPAARDRAPEAAAEGAAAAAPARAAGLDPGPRRRARLRPRAFARSHAVAAHRPPRGRPARPRGLLRRRDRRARVRDLPHRRLSGVGRARADRARAPTSSRRAAVGLRALPARAPPRHAAPPAGRADLAGAGQPRGLRARPPPDRPGRARSAPATRATPTTSCSPATTTCATAGGDDRRDRRRRGLPPQRRQDPRDGPRHAPDRHRHRRQRPPQRPARRLRRAQGDPPPRVAARPAPASTRPHLLGRIAWVEALNPARGAKLRATFTSIGW